MSLQLTGRRSAHKQGSAEGTGREEWDSASCPSDMQQETLQLQLPGTNADRRRPWSKPRFSNSTFTSPPCGVTPSTETSPHGPRHAAARGELTSVKGKVHCSSLSLSSIPSALVVGQNWCCRCFSTGAGRVIFTKEQGKSVLRCSEPLTSYMRPSA